MLPGVSCGDAFDWAAERELRATTGFVGTDPQNLALLKVNERIGLLATTDS